MPATEFEAQFGELAELAYRTAYRILGSRADAEEIAQETLTKAHVRWRRVRGHARPWVCRVAANAALGVVRKQRRRPLQVAAATQPDAADAIDRLDLQRLLVALPRRQREVIVLRYLADLSEAETARELGVSIGSIKTHSHRALEALRTAIARDPDPERKAVFDA